MDNQLIERPSLMRNHFKPYNGDDQGGKEEQSQKSGRFLEHKNPYQNGPDRTDSCPNGIGSTDGQGLGGLDQKGHAQGEGHQKPGIPKVHFGPCGLFCLAQTEGKRYFKQSGDDQCDPVHVMLKLGFGEFNVRGLKIVDR